MVVLGVGIWLVADKSSFVALIKAVDHEQVQVSEESRTFYVIVCVCRVRGKERGKGKGIYRCD